MFDGCASNPPTAVEEAPFWVVTVEPLMVTVSALLPMASLESSSRVHRPRYHCIAVPNSTPLNRFLVVKLSLTINAPAGLSAVRFSVIPTPSESR